MFGYTLQNNFPNFFLRFLFKSKIKSKSNLKSEGEFQIPLGAKLLEIIQVAYTENSINLSLRISFKRGENINMIIHIITVNIKLFILYLNI